MKKITIYTSLRCPFCIRAKELLKREGVSFAELDISDGDSENFNQMQQKCDARSVPQIFVEDEHLGGCAELEALIKAGQFHNLFLD